MRRREQQPRRTPEQSAEQKESMDRQEVKWVYTMGVPLEEGDPSMQIVIGVPQSHNETGWMLPNGFDEEHINYTIDVPLNLIVDGKRIECVAQGTVMGDIGGNRFALNGIKTNEEIPEDTTDALQRAYDKVLDPRSNRTVLSALQEEIERQCRGYFIQRRTEKGIEG